MAPSDGLVGEGPPRWVELWWRTRLGSWTSASETWAAAPPLSPTVLAQGHQGRGDCVHPDPDSCSPRVHSRALSGWAGVCWGLLGSAALLCLLSSPWLARTSRRALLGPLSGHPWHRTRGGRKGQGVLWGLRAFLPVSEDPPRHPHPAHGDPLQQEGALKSQKLPGWGVRGPGGTP